MKQKDLGPAVDEKQAESDAGGTVKEIYAAIGRGKTDNLFSLLNDPLFVFGPRQSDATTTREDALVALSKVVTPKSKQTIASGQLAVFASPGGHSAWAFDMVNAEGQSLAVMAVLRNDDDIWSVTVAALAQTPSMKEIRAKLKDVAIVPPGAKTVEKIDARAAGAVDKFKKGLLAQEIWGEDLASRTESMWIGPASGDIAHGKKEIKKLWKKRLEAETRAATSGTIVAEVTPDGQLAWVTAPVTRVEKDEAPLPLRVFAVFEKDGDNWKMIALHESLAVDAPGAGAPFVKILPPAPAAVKEEPPPPPEETKKDKKKKKKKKKGGDDDVEADEEKPKKLKKKAVDEDEETVETPKKKKKKQVDDEDSDEDRPKKKKKKRHDDDEDS